VDGYDCEFEGLAWQSPEPDIGFSGGFEEWELLSATDDCGRELSDESRRELELSIVAREWVGTEIIVKLNNAREEDYDDEA
jgi:hypothetical protein